MRTTLKIGTAVSAPFTVEVLKLDAPNGGEEALNQTLRSYLVDNQSECAFGPPCAAFLHAGQWGHMEDH